ncbi:heterochromatin protein 1K chromodomain [Drosophila willistoni]|uniref:Heterochromatin protein 1K chromodomain n=1 Tax=Drosophila willistoni TaxID=7260 RepID=B4N2E8_DROWI|nr:chromodomain Y-like protein [Drosophila willistoni]EDW78537.1 heterochromatin protein 1K chromodomain [Drosophila willistoni]
MSETSSKSTTKTQRKAKKQKKKPKMARLARKSMCPLGENQTGISSVAVGELKAIPEEELPIHEVEAVVSHRVVNGRTEYFLKWKGFPESANSWEPRSHILCSELLREYSRKPRELARSFLIV